MIETNCDEIPIIVWADIEISPMGLKSKLLETIGPRSVLRQTAERICRTKLSGRKIFICRPEQENKITSVLMGLPIEIIPMEVKLPNWHRGLQAARKWALDCWRGGLVNACAFDEDLMVHILEHIAKRLNVKAVMVVQAHAAWIDPDIVDRQIMQYREHSEEIDFTFTQAPPGISGLILGRKTLSELLTGMKIAGPLIGYNIQKPYYDQIGLACNLPIDPAVVHTPYRFTCDTNRGLALARRLAELVDPLSVSATELVTHAKKEAPFTILQWPEEIEIELVTGWPWPAGYRPSPSSPRGPIDADMTIKRIAELAEQIDDLVICLGGFGEPTCHPQFEAIVKGLKSAGVLGISLSTTGLYEQEKSNLIASLPIDVVSMLIDIPDRELYARLMGVDAYETVLANTNKIIETVLKENLPTPLVVPEMIKTYDTMELMDSFYDGWLARTGSAVIRGYSDYAGQIPDLAVNSMAPPIRHTCRQIMRRMMVLADGRVPQCDQDYEGRCIAGDIRNESLLDIWQGKYFNSLRADQLSQNILCERCRQWHRP
jgi:spiro-SPASM protein